MLGTIDAAEGYQISSDLKPGAVLAAFKAAAPHLGIRANLVFAVDWLFKFTNPIDWTAASRPIVWPSCRLQREELSLGYSQVKTLNRRLVELGLVIMRDSPNGKRYGDRGPQGQIKEAFGFDLTPLAQRYSEFVGIAERIKAEREEIRNLKRRASIARKAIRQLEALASCEGLCGTERIATLLASAEAASCGLAGRGGPIEMAAGVMRLERLQKDLQHEVQTCLDVEAASAAKCANKPVETGPTGPAKWPDITTTKDPINPKDTVETNGHGYDQPAVRTNVLAHQDGGDERTTHNSIDRVTDTFRHSERTPNTKPTEPSTNITPEELLRLAPRLKQYISGRQQTWPAIVDAADWVRSEFGITKHLWSNACVEMGREHAAMAIAIVSTKPADHFRSGPAGYFHGMVTKARSGELNLDRTIWAMRRQERGLFKSYQ